MALAEEGRRRVLLIAASILAAVYSRSCSAPS